MSFTKPCKVCGCGQEHRPVIYRGEDWCSGRCREIAEGDES